jgi:hypothetical protein
MHFLSGGTHKGFPSLSDVSKDISSCQEEILEMTRHDQELLAKQLWAISDPPRQNTTTIGLIIVAVFLVGIGVGDILSKTKQTNTHYAALISYPNGQE